MSQPSRHPSQLFTELEASKLLGFTPRALTAWRHRGGGPRFVKVSARAIRYRLSDLEAWIEARVRTSTSDPGGDGHAAG